MTDVTELDVAFLARAASGETKPVAAWEVVSAVDRPANMTTSALERLRGTFEDGTSFSVFIKTLHPATASPMWDQIPEMFHASVLEDLNWLDEPRVYSCGLCDDLPDGLRMPAVYRIDETPSTIIMFLEDIPDSSTWDLARYRRSARALGRLTGRWPGDRAASEIAAPKRPIGRLFFGKILNFDLQIMAGDDFWEDSGIAGATDAAYRNDLRRLAERMPHLLERLDGLPQALSHGDAAPDNLREPGDGTIAAIDWSYCSVAPVGSDLGQLLSGRIEVEGRPPGQSIALLEAVIDEYLTGLADEGMHVARDDVRRGCITYLAVRFVFSALLLEPGSGIPDVDRLERRAALGRTGLDLALDLPGIDPAR